jgi:effector-binding domain-containing protein
LAGERTTIPYYHSYEGDEIDVDRGIPVKSATTGTGRVRRFTLPAVRAARTVHVGPYVDIVKTHQSLERWIRDSGHEPVDHMWETYLNYPTEVMPEKLMTEIIWPIK